MGSIQVPSRFGRRPGIAALVHSHVRQYNAGMSKSFQIELDHNLGTHGANKAMENACDYYAKKYPQAGISWKKPTPTSFVLNLSFGGMSGVVKGEAMRDKVVLSLDVPDGTNVPETILKMFVRREASKWL